MFLKYFPYQGHKQTWFDKEKSSALSALYVEPHILYGNVEDLRTGGRWSDPQLGQYFFPRIDDSHCDRIHSSLTVVCCFDDDYVGK